MQMVGKKKFSYKKDGKKKEEGLEKEFKEEEIVEKK